MLGQLPEQLAMLREYQESPEPEGATTLRYRGAERCLYLAARCCVDIGKQMVQGLRLREPKHQRDLVDVLREAEVISEETTSFLYHLVHLRKCLLLGEWLPEPGYFHGVLPGAISGCERFAREIEACLDKVK
jgi:uncharacterized protein YutE (UPF0331/DUF86 family)